MDKTRAVLALREAVVRDLVASQAMTQSARDEATSSESKAENKYDTRATEASYLAAGQGQRLAGLTALADWLGQLEPRAVHHRVAVGALVQLRRGSAREWVLFAPEGGHRASVDGVDVRLLSVRSPTGEVLAGLGAGDIEEIEAPGGLVEVEVIHVA